MKLKPSLLALALVFTSFPAWGALKSQTIDYKYEGKVLKGYLVYDDAISGKRPGVLVFHEVWGLNDYAKSRAQQLAQAGYVAFAADMFGEGKVATHLEDAKEMSAEVTSKLPLWVGRAQAAMKTLQEQPMVDPQRLAAIGYCFGGGTVLKLAYDGAPLKLAATFHGALSAPENPQNIKAKLLIFHGGKDGFISADTIAQMKAKLDQGKVSYKWVVFPDAMHGFTVPGSEKLGIQGVAYNADADKKSWAQLLAALKKI